MFIAPVIQRRCITHGGVAFELIHDLAMFFRRRNDQALENVPTAVIDINQTAQFWGHCGIHGKAIVPEAQQWKHSLTHLNPQA